MKQGLSPKLEIIVISRLHAFRHGWHAASDSRFSNMNLKSLLIIAGLIATLPLSAQTKGPKIPSKKEQAPKAAQAVARPNAHLIRAKAFFDQGKMAESSTEIFKTVDSIHKRMLTAESLPTEGVIRATNNLESLAERVSEGKVKDGRVLDRKFAKANHEMAKYYAELARVAAGQQKPRLTRSAFGRVADYIDNTAQWSGRKLKPEGRKTVDNMRKVAAKKDKAGKAVTAESEELLEKAPSIIERLGQIIKTKPKSPDKPRKTGKKK